MILNISHGYDPINQSDIILGTEGPNDGRKVVEKVALERLDTLYTYFSFVKYLIFYKVESMLSKTIFTEIVNIRNGST